MNICVIPARGGSKRIPGKNIKEFCGQPIIAYSIAAAKAAACFDHIYVSTDDAHIAEIARHYGAEVPFTRPKTLADDFTGTIPVINDALQWCQNNALNPDFLCCIYATAPMIRPQDILDGLELLKREKCDYSFSATSFPFPIQRAFRMMDSGRVSMFQPENFNTRSQDLEEAFHDAAQFYWGTTEAWLKQTPFFSQNSTALILPRHRVQDIDTVEDWQRAELMFKLNQQTCADTCE